MNAIQVFPDLQHWLEFVDVAKNHILSREACTVVYDTLVPELPTSIEMVDSSTGAMEIYLDSRAIAEFRISLRPAGWTEV